MAQSGSEFEYEDDDFQPADPEAYTEATTETDTVPLEEGPGAFRVRTIAPLRLIRDAERFGVSALLSGEDDDADMQALLQDGDLNGFIDETVVPNVIEPAVYWSEPPESVAESDAFDLAALHPTDLVNVIMGLVSVDEERLAQEMDDRFRG